MSGKYDGICGIDRAHLEELLAVSGMGIAKTAQVKAAFETGEKAHGQETQSEGFNNASEAAACIRHRAMNRRTFSVKGISKRPIQYQ